MEKKFKAHGEVESTLKKDLNKLTSIIKKNKNIDDIFFNKVYNLNKINLAVNDLKIGKAIRPLIKL